MEIHGVDLDAFTAAYIECALWSSTDESDDQGGEPLDWHYTLNDIAPETLLKMREDCQAFQRENAERLSQSGLSDESAGHDFWLTRNGHGSGFWDEGLGKIGQKLTDAAHACGEVDLYIGDDGMIHA